MREYVSKILVLNPPIVFRRSFPIKWRIILRVFWILNVLLILSLLIFCVFQINAEVSERYLIQRYEKELNQALKENQNLEIGSVEAGSLENIVVLLEGLNLEKAEKTHYIRVLDGKVVAK
jgi:hypothetical protein